MVPSRKFYPAWVIVGTNIYQGYHVSIYLRLGTSLGHKEYPPTVENLHEQRSVPSEPVARIP